MSTIEQWLHLPQVFDLKKQYQINFIITLLRVALACNLASSVLFFFLWQSKDIYYLIISQVSIYVIVCVAFLLVKVGLVEWARGFISFSIWGLLAVLSLFNANIIGVPFIVCIAITPLVGGFLAGTRSSLFISLLNLGMGLWLAWQPSKDNLLVQQPSGALIYLAAYAVTFSLIPVIVYFWQQRTEEMVRQTKQVEIARQETAVYQIENERLEEAVAERTQALQASLDRETALAIQLQQALNAEKEINRNLYRIIARISHEFRTPLTVINTAEYILYRHGHKLSEEKKAKHHESIKTAIEYLTKLLQEINYLTITQRREIAVERSSYQFSAFCQQLEQELRQVLNSPMRLEFAYELASEAALETDFHVVQQIMLNLLLNALNYSAESAAVQVTIMLQSAELYIQVSDNGIGIPPEEQEQIFDLFYRANNAEDHRGLGLGLYISRSLANLLGGSITAFSEGAGQGSTFTLSLPVA